MRYFDEVEVDIHDIKIWYKEQKDGLEMEFAIAIEKAINHILEIPEAYALRYKKIRIAHPKKFPYNIHFYIDEPNSTLVVTAVVHGKRHSKIAKKRI